MSSVTESRAHARAYAFELLIRIGPSQAAREVGIGQKALIWCSSGGRSHAGTIAALKLHELNPPAAPERTSLREDFIRAGRELLAKNEALASAKESES